MLFCGGGLEIYEKKTAGRTMRSLFDDGYRVVSKHLFFTLIRLVLVLVLIALTNGRQARNENLVENRHGDEKTDAAPETRLMIDRREKVKMGRHYALPFCDSYGRRRALEKDVKSLFATIP